MAIGKGRTKRPRSPILTRLVPEEVPHHLPSPKWMPGGEKLTVMRTGVPVPLLRELWALRKQLRPADDAPLFTRPDGQRLDRTRLFHVVRAAGGRAGVPWVGLHTLRHTCGSMLFAHGLNAKQVQAWVGHHSASFTLDVYIHLLDDDLPDAAFLDALGVADTAVAKGASASNDRVVQNSEQGEPSVPSSSLSQRSPVRLPSAQEAQARPARRSARAG